jgi:hypothetical protein
MGGRRSYSRIFSFESANASLTHQLRYFERSSYPLRGLMLTGIAALEHTYWSRLHHAYGRATDTPGHLRALLQDDLESREQAMSHLWSAIIHQGTPWTATGPAALVVAGLLSDERIDHVEPIRAGLLSFLVSVKVGLPYDRQSCARRLRET